MGGVERALYNGDEPAHRAVGGADEKDSPDLLNALSRPVAVPVRRETLLAVRGGSEEATTTTAAGSPLHQAQEHETPGTWMKVGRKKINE